MGFGLSFDCSNCDYTVRYFYNVGKIRPNAGFLDDMKNVDDVRWFIERFPDGYVVYDQVVKRCKNCGALKNEMDLSMYLPNTPVRRVRDFTHSDRHFIDLRTAESMSLKKYKDHDFVCEQCGHTEMELIDMDQLENMAKNGQLRCPHCGSVLDYYHMGYIRWD